MFKVFGQGFNQFQANFPFLYQCFLTFSGGIEMKHLAKTFFYHYQPEMVKRKISLTLPALRISEGFIKININLNFYFHVSL